MTIDITDPIGRQIDPAVVGKGLPGLLDLLQQRRIRTCAQFVAEPEVIVLERKLAPTGSAIEIDRAVAADIFEAGSRQQMQSARKLGDDLQNLLQIVLQIHARQHADGVGLSEQGFDHGVSAMVRGAQHHHQAVGLLDQRFPECRVLLERCANHQPTHAVREQADAAFGLFAKLFAQIRSQLRPQIRQRLAPIVGIRNDLMGFVKVVMQLLIGRFDQATAADLRRTHGDTVQAIQGKFQRVEPERFTANRQAAAHDPGQQEHQRPGLQLPLDQQHIALASFRRQHSASGHQRPVQQPVAQTAGQRTIAVPDGIAKIVKVIDLRPFDRHGVRFLGVIEQTAVHGVGVDYQVITGAVEQCPVDEHVTDSLQNTAGRFVGIASNDGHLQVRLRPGPCQQHAHRRLGQHRLNARHHLRLHTLVGDFQHHALEQFQATGRNLRGGASSCRGSERPHRGANTPAGELAHQAQQAGQKYIEVVRQQRSAAGRSGDTDIVGDLQAFVLEQLYQLVELLAFRPCKGLTLPG
ncbi:hypothetical protein D3C80_792660 [compost metagenome]